MLAHRNEHQMLQVAIDSMGAVANSTDENTILPMGDRESTAEPEEERGYLEPLYTSLLRFAMDASPVRVFSRRCIHKGNFRHAKLETLLLLLRMGADPLMGDSLIYDVTISREVDALAIAVATNDHEALQLFIDHLTKRGEDIQTLLADPARFDGYTAVHQSIYHDAPDVFMSLVKNYPALLSMEGRHRRKPLHMAATREWPGYVTELLRRGANLYDRTTDGSTPFTLAVMNNPSLKIADLLADSCEDMERILGDDGTTHYTAFGKVLHGLVIYRMGYGMERLKYLIDKFGPPSIFACESTQITIFRCVLEQYTSPTDMAHLALEDLVLELLLTTFPNSVDFIDFSGRSPLHYAAMNGRKSAVEILLKHKAQVNLRTVVANFEAVRLREDHPKLDDETLAALRDYTPLNLAARSQSNGPQERVLQAGEREVAQWTRNMKEIIRLLLDHGANTDGQNLETFLLNSIASGVENLAIVRSQFLKFLCLLSQLGFSTNTACRYCENPTRK